MSISKVDIINLLLKYPNGLKARQIASYLSSDRKIINQILYKNSNDFIVNDLYIWKIKNQTQNIYAIQKSIREETLNELNNVYKLGYLERRELEKLTFETFQRAVEHAKIIATNRNLPYMTLKEWFSIVVLEPNEFEQTIKVLEDGEKRKQEEIKEKREIRNKELMEIADFCNKQNLSESTKAKLVLTGKTYYEISIIWRLCRENDITEFAFLSLLENNISYCELEKRISKIKYYKSNYPNMNFVLSTHVLYSEQEFNEYINVSIQKPTVRCLGDCSNCKRDKCIIDK